MVLGCRILTYTAPLGGEWTRDQLQLGWKTTNLVTLLAEWVSILT